MGIPFEAEARQPEKIADKDLDHADAITVTKAAEVLRTSKSKVYAAVKANRLPSQAGLNGELVISLSKLTAWVRYSNDPLAKRVRKWVVQQQRQQLRPST